MKRGSKHVVLAGDSVFDNRSYTQGQPDVLGHVKQLLPASWQASLRAVDGATTADFHGQLRQFPADASDLVISLGGNDALMNSDLLDFPIESTAQALRLFGDRIHRFESSYQSAIRSAVALGCQTTVCTIYSGDLDVREAALARIGLMLFNDVILHVAFEHHLSVIDLRLILTEPADYANPIEPSGQGGRKIAAAIARAIGAETAAIHSKVFGG